MQLRVVSRYRNEGLEADYQPGMILHLKDEEGEFLLRDSPGSFEVHMEAPEEPAPELKPSETETGVAAVDRRARGGARR